MNFSGNEIRLNSLHEWVLKHMDPLIIYQNYITLRPSGNRWVGLCPIHPEKTPSFNYYTETASFYCFGCHASGDEIKFLQYVENLDIPGVLRLLQERYSLPKIPWQPRTPEDEARVYTENLLTVAWEFYRQCLSSPVAVQARAYLENRGIPPEKYAVYGLGYAPHGGRELLNHVRKMMSVPDWALKESGLFNRRDAEEDTPGQSLKSPERDEWYDFFRDRIIFPIHDGAGRVIALAGRALQPDALPKYLNQRETLLFKKSQCLFGLGWAGEAIRERREVILVEGYFDAILMHLNGFTCTLAVLGSHLTMEQTQWLKRRAERVILAFDGDEAGRKAAWESLKSLLPHFDHVHGLVFPEGQDPADILRGINGKRKLTLQYQRAVDWAEYLVDTLQRQFGQDYLSRREALKTVFEILAPLEATGSVRTMQFSMNLARWMGLNSPRQLYTDFLIWRRQSVRKGRKTLPLSGNRDKLQGGVGPENAPSLTLSNAIVVPLHERIVLQGLMENPARFETLLGSFGIQVLESTDLKEVFQYLLESWYNNTFPDWPMLWEKFNGTPLLGTVSRVMTEKSEPVGEELFLQSIAMIQVRYLRAQCRFIDQQLGALPNDPIHYKGLISQKFSYLRQAIELESRLGRHRLSGQSSKA